MDDHPRLRSTELALLFLLALLVRAIHLDAPPRWDELYHYFAAQSWLTDGTLHADGAPYHRAWIYTHLVAAVFGLFGQDLVFARMVSVVAGSLATLGVAIWTTRVGGRGAGYIAALMICFSRLDIELSQFARSYACQGLCFWLAAVLLYELVIGRPQAWRACGSAVGVVVLMGLALHLQPSTYIGSVGLGAWLLATSVVCWGGRIARDKRARRWVYTAVPAVLLLVVLFAQSDRAAQMWISFRFSPGWAVAHRTDLWYYHNFFMQEYRTLYCLFPLALGAGLWRRPRPTLFCATIFLTTLLIHSVAAQKQPRYLAYAVPFFFAVWGIGATQLAQQVAEALRSTATWRSGLLRYPQRRAVAKAFVVATLGTAVIATNLSFPYGLLMVVTAPLQPRWDDALPTLRPLAAEAGVIVASTDLKPLYYLQRSCVVASYQMLVQKAGMAAEFSPAPTGRPIISTPESMARLVASQPVGLVVIEREHWGRREFVSMDLARYLEGQLEAVVLPAHCGLLAFRWSRPIERPGLQASAESPAP